MTDEEFDLWVPQGSLRHPKALNQRSVWQGEDSFWDGINGRTYLIRRAIVDEPHLFSVWPFLALI